MLTIQQIIIELKNITDNSIPYLSNNILEHSQNIHEKLKIIQNISGIIAPVSTPLYATHYISFIQAIFEARQTISDTLNITTRISMLASDMQKIQTSDVRAMSIINKQIEFCDDLVEELSEFTDLVTQSLRQFGRIFANNNDFRRNFAFLMRHDGNDNFIAWCEYWINYASINVHQEDTPLQGAINMIAAREAVTNVNQQFGLMTVS